MPKLVRFIFHLYVPFFALCNTTKGDTIRQGRREKERKIKGERERERTRELEGERNTAP